MLKVGSSFLFCRPSRWLTRVCILRSPTSPVFPLARHMMLKWFTHIRQIWFLVLDVYHSFCEEHSCSYVTLLSSQRSPNSQVSSLWSPNGAGAMDTHDLIRSSLFPEGPISKHHSHRKLGDHAGNSWIWGKYTETTVVLPLGWLI